MNEPTELFPYWNIGSKVKELRLKVGLTQEQLASLIDINRSSIANLEMGNQRASLITLYKLAHIFMVEINEILPSLKELSGNSKLPFDHSLYTTQQIEWIYRVVKIGMKSC